MTAPPPAVVNIQLTHDNALVLCALIVFLDRLTSEPEMDMVAAIFPHKVQRSFCNLMTAMAGKKCFAEVTAMGAEEFANVTLEKMISLRNLASTLIHNLPPE